MRRFPLVPVVVAFGLAGALASAAPTGASTRATRRRCRATAFVANNGSDTVSTIDMNARTKNPGDIAVGASPLEMALTPDGKTAFVSHNNVLDEALPGTVSTIDLKTGTKNSDDIAVGSGSLGVAITPCRR